MQWPSRAEYTEAVRDYPHISLQDSRLRGGKPRRGRDNLVISDTGAFSIVFPIDIVSRTFALRCWVKDVGDAKNRYEKISAYLKQVGLPYFVDFEYVPEGILVNGTKYPITRMEWVEGVSLREFIEQNLQNPHIFKVVADEFQKMVSALHKHQIAHGDLQDGNILLKRNGNSVEIKLIDYDSLFVPKLQGQPEQILGLPEYQHPKRMTGGGQANEKVDHFSELVIYLSFLSLSENPALWTQFGDEKRVDRGLLFSKEDFENPSRSPVFRELAKLSLNVQQLAATLKDFCDKTSIDQLVPLETVLPKQDANTYCNQGESFLSDDCYDEALAEFQKAIDIKPNYARAYFGRGHVYRRTKQYTNAIIAFQQAIKFKPNYKEAHYGLALVYFESGDNSKAETATDAVLKIDSHYQPARDLLDVIKTSSTSSVTPPPTAKSTSTSTSPTSSSIPSQSTRSNPLPNVTKNIIETLKNHWQSVAMATLGLALVLCFITLLIQMNTGNKVHPNEITKLRNQLDQKKSKIQGLTSSVQILENDKKKLNRENDRLWDDLEDLRAASNTMRRDVINQQQQLSETEAALASWVNKSQKLQSQLDKKDAEIRQLRNDKAAAINENRRLQNQIDESTSGAANQNTIVRQLQKEKAEMLTENRRLRYQLAEKTSEAKNLTDHVQRLQNEKIKTQRQNQKLQGENAGLARQNRNLRNENEALRNQLDKAKQENAEEVIGPEPPKKIPYDGNVLYRVASPNNLGWKAFEDNDYDKAIRRFEQAIKADSKLEIAHYNLGCAYLKMKKYTGAVDAFDKAVDLDPRFKEAHYNLSLARFRINTLQQAKQAVEKALSIDPNYQLAQELLTEIENAQQ